MKIIIQERYLTVEPVAMMSVWYLNVSPAALVRVFEARSALTISVLSIKDIPANHHDMTM